MKQNNNQTGHDLNTEIIEMKQIKNQSEQYFNKESILADFRMANLSRSLSIIGRREVLTGKAKFGIFGDGMGIGDRVIIATKHG
jgi:ribose 5-phosphate isomerase RpiB